MSKLTGTIITDCGDDLARGRQELYFESLFGIKPTFLSVGSYLPIEAAGSLLDMLDVLVNFPGVGTDQENIVLVNVAPRGEDVQKKWDNGTPFCYFRVGKTLVVSTYEEQYLSVLRDHETVRAVELLDISTVTVAAVERGDISAAQADKICNTQFRSLEFLPLVASWLQQGKQVPSEKQSLSELPSAPGQVWQVDCFDDVKTTLLPKDIGFEQGKQVVLANGKPATCYTRLADVPQNVTALTIGSSGYGQNRFLEVVIGHRGRAASEHGFVVGAPVLEVANELRGEQ